jgi:hypothetical protein
MTDSPSHDYFQRRAEEEREAAEQAADERAAHSHRELADHYARLAGDEGQPPADAREEPQPPGILPREFRILP